MRINDYKDQRLNHINAVVPYLIILLSGTLERREDKALGIGMAGGTCLCLLALLVEDRVVDSVVPFLFNSTKAPHAGDNVVDSVKEYLARIDCKHMEVELKLQKHGTTSNGDVFTALQLVAEARAEHSMIANILRNHSNDDNRDGLQRSLLL
ncbi:hypothetical protein ACE6H2_014895 [Prunus campanulata]